MIHLGYEVGTGAAVEIPLGHLAITGQTQLSGKTTTLEALIARSGKCALAFVTKRGEGSFAGGRRIPPYFRERADWQFVESVLESAMRQKMRFERAWIVRAAKGASTLAGVQANVRKLMESSKGLSADVYMLLNEYLQVVVPLIAQLPPAAKVDLRPGLNVMDLTPYPSQMQGLVIRSALLWIYEHEQNVLTVIPEAWEFVPQARGSPVKLAASQLVRKGAALGNYVWIDSQDLAGVDKDVIRQCSVWLIGVQREMNELRRALAHIPAGVKKPRPEDVATLGRGQFWACWHERTVKVYVQPEWMLGTVAEDIALGRGVSGEGRGARGESGFAQGETAMADDLVMRQLERLTEVVTQLLPRPTSEPLVATTKLVAAGVNHSPLAPAPAPLPEEMYQRFKTRLLEEAAEDPRLLSVLTQRPELRVQVEREVVELDGRTLVGRLALLISEGYFDEPRAGNAAYQELQRRGFSTAKPNVYREADKLAARGFLTKEGAGYQAVKGMKTSVVEKR